MTEMIRHYEQTGEEMALLNLLVTSDSVLKNYIGDSKTWATVTPVILPGHDDVKKASQESYREALLQKEEKIEALIRKAFRHAGFPDSFMSQAQLEWNKMGLTKGCEHASCYHVRIVFTDSVSGPIAVESGRFRGFGVFCHL